MVAVSVANICLVTMDISCQATYKNVSRNISNGSRNISNGSQNYILLEKVQLHPDTCLTSLEITTAFLALCGATCLWSISAGNCHQMLVFLPKYLISMFKDTFSCIVYSQTMFMFII